MFSASIAGLPAFLLYFLCGGALTFAFALLYLRLTPHDELALVRAGKTAPAIALGGNLVGFSIPLDKAVEQAGNLPDLLVWAVVAGVVQLLVFGLLRWLMPGLSERIEANDHAAATLLAAVAVTAGMLNSASMSL